jgi:hypothetical protein
MFIVLDFKVDENAQQRSAPRVEDATRFEKKSATNVVKIQRKIFISKDLRSEIVYHLEGICTLIVPCIGLRGTVF